MTHTNTYVEVAPTGPQHHGDVGGDRQLGESWGRRFRREQLTPDGEHVVVNVTFYIEAGDIGEDEPTVLMREVEYMLCRDPADPGSTETWSDTRYEQIAVEGTPTELFAQAMCAAFDSAAITWNGEPLISGRSHPVRDAVDYHALITASWLVTTQTWRVSARPSANVDWVVHEGDASTLETLLAMAGRVAVGD